MSVQKIVEKSIEICNKYIAKTSLLGGCNFVFAINTNKEDKSVCGKISIAYTKNKGYDTIQIPDFVDFIGVKINNKNYFEHISERDLENNNYILVPKIDLDISLAFIENKKYNYAFNDTKIKKVILGKNIKEIYDCSFAESELKEIVVNSKLSIIENSSFLNCKYLERINIEDASDKLIIKEAAFKRCSKLDNIILNNVIEIERYAFGYCDSLKCVELPKNDTFKTIKQCTFLSCESIRNITIPKNITHIEMRSFYNYTNKLERVVIKSETEIILDEAAFMSAHNMSLIIENNIIDNFKLYTNAISTNCKVIVNNEVIETNEFIRRCTI